MQGLKSFFKIGFGVVLLVAIGTFVIVKWSWVFSKRVSGEIVDVKRVTNPAAIINSNVTASQIHSYAVLIKGDDGVLYPASSEDRQWEVAHKGYCVEALLYRYPPWDLEKGGTFFNARVKRINVCPGKEAEPAPETTLPAVKPTLEVLTPPAEGPAN